MSLTTDDADAALADGPSLRAIELQSAVLRDRIAALAGQLDAIATDAARLADLYWARSPELRRASEVLAYRCRKSARMVRQGLFP
jgi:hypothetical protein